MIDRMAADSGRRKYLVHYLSGIVFKILDPIGRDHDNIPVYKVAWSAGEHNSGGSDGRKLIEDEFLSVKRVNYSDSESVFPFAKLYGEIIRKNMAGIVLPCHHKYLMPVNSYFIEQETEDLCLVMPFCELGSLRSAMSGSKFRHGLPETCISVALRCVLKALKFLNRFRHFHMNVNAGHIYLKSGPRIFLGFAATLYEHGVCNAESSSHSSLPVTQICDWAAAPEVYSVRNDDARYRHRYTDKSDVWLVGITALELAYGSIRVPNREALEKMIKEIIRTKTLPKKLFCGGIDDDREEAHEYKSDKGKRKVEEEGRGMRNNPHQQVDSEEIRASFSREFGAMVADCFTWDPWDRPTANSLLNHDFFDKNGLTRSALKSHFQDVLIQMEEDILKKMKNPSPSPLRVAAPDFSHNNNNEDDENDNNNNYKSSDINMGFSNLDPQSTPRSMPESHITTPRNPDGRSSPALTDVPLKLRFKRKLTYEDVDQETKKAKIQEKDSEETSSASPINDTYASSSPVPPPEYLVHNSSKMVFRIMSMDPIGISPLGKLPVYRVAYSECDLSSFYHRKFLYDKFALAIIVNSRRNPIGYKLLEYELQTKNEELLYLNANVMHVEDSFVDRESRDYCIVMGHGGWGSLRSIMAKHFPNGLPESFISLILRSVLGAVCFLHEDSAIHGDISAGHVYVQSGPNIKMGFGATVYEHGVFNLECSSSSALPETYISRWAAAPEVYNHEGKNHGSTEESDVWLVGITALELAYGGLRVPNREALEVMVREIHEKKRLPKRYPPSGQSLDQQQQQLTREVGGKGKHIMIEEEDYGDGSSEERSFSREFEKIVAECLAWKPWERPTASTLLNHEFFVVKGMDALELESHFEDVLMDRLRK